MTTDKQVTVNMGRDMYDAFMRMLADLEEADPLSRKYNKSQYMRELLAERIMEHIAINETIKVSITDENGLPFTSPEAVEAYKEWVAEKFNKTGRA